MEDTLHSANRPGRGRRNFLKTAGGVFAAATLGKVALGGPAAAANLDIAVLQFALNLEYLEAEFYRRAAYGAGLPVGLTGPSPGYVTGGHQVPFQSPLIQAYAQEIAQEETKHVEFLRAVLTSLNANIPQPAIDLDTSFKTLGQAAGLGLNWSPFDNDIDFLLGAYIFEDVGVTAYHGAAALITDPNILRKAAGILATEAYHAGLVRTVLFANDMSSATQSISHLRAVLDGTAGTSSVDDHGVGTVQAPTIADVSVQGNGPILGGYPNPPPGNNAIAYERTPRQVLNIVYGAANAKSGLFFPKGLNGAITS